MCYVLDGTTPINDIYDIVIIATPLTRDYDMSISFDNFPDDMDFMVPGEYQTTVATFLKGTLNALHFSLEEAESIDIFSCAPNVTKISAVAAQSDVNDSLDESSLKTWKIFSREKLALPYIARLFHKVRTLVQFI